MKHLYIGFSNPKSKFPLFSWLIRLFDRSEYSHTYIRWNSEYIDEPVCYEASGFVLKFKGSKAFERTIDPIREYVLSVSSEEYRSVVKYCMSNAGKPYGFFQIIGMAFARLFRTRNFLADGTKSQVCSEVVGHILEDILAYSIDIDLELAGPKDLEAKIISEGIPLWIK